VPAVSGNALLGDLDDDALAALLATVGPGSTTALLFAELRHLGGALARPADGAVDSIPGSYSLFGGAPAPTVEAASAGAADAAALVEAMRPWSLAAHALNFAEGAVDVASCFEPEAWDRLRAVRAAVDPGGLFLANHEIG
jgi:hypothetical protein